jgi:hypothetical protein
MGSIIIDDVGHIKDDNLGLIVKIFQEMSKQDSLWGDQRILPMRPSYITKDYM